MVARPIHLCKSKHLAEHEDIISVQKELSLHFPVTVAGSKKDLLNNLAASINHLIRADFSRLVTSLYRLDISETKLKKTLEDNVDTDAGKLIAALIIERQIQKIKTRAQFRRQQDIPDDEKW